MLDSLRSFRLLQLDVFRHDSKISPWQMLFQLDTSDLVFRHTQVHTSYANQNEEGKIMHNAIRNAICLPMSYHLFNL